MDVALGSHLAKGAIAIGRILFGADFFAGNAPGGGY